MLLIGAILGAFLAIICCVLPPLETPFMVALVIGGQAHILAPEVVVGALIIKSALTYGLSLLEERDSKKANTLAFCGLTTTTPIMLGCAVLLILSIWSGRSVVSYFPEMNQSLAALSVVAIPAALASYWYLCVPREKKLAYAGILLVATISTVITIKCSGTPLAMAVVALSLNMRLPEEKKSTLSVETDEIERMSPTGLEFVSTLFATILIGLSPSILYAIGRHAEKRLTGKTHSECSAMSDHLQKLLSVTLLLTLGLGRDTTADSIKRVIEEPISGIVALILLIIVWLVAWQMTEHLSDLREWKKSLPTITPLLEWVVKCAALLITFMLLSLPLWMGGIAILLGMGIGEVAKRTGTEDTLRTPFSTLPLLGISGVL